MSSDIDELDELLGLIDEDDDFEEKKHHQIQVAHNEKNKTDSEIYVCASIRCKLRVDPTTRAISSSSLSLRLRHWKFVSLINLPLKLHNKSIVNKEFVIIGILASKNIKTSKNNTKYLLLKIDDFNANISCFIFNSEIIEKFYKIIPGTILVIAGPQIMNDKNNNNQTNNNISLKIDKNEQILIIGKSIDFGFCLKCSTIINKSKSSLCLFHKNLQYKKYASRRSDANRGTINLNRNKISKKSLSGSMHKNMNFNKNGVSMMQIRNNKYNKYNKNNKNKINKSDRNTKENRKKTANLILKSPAITPFLRQRLMKKCVKGSKHILANENNKKNEEIKKLLRGKPLIPQLGSNWNNNNNSSNASNIILLNPKSKPLNVINSQKKAENIINKNKIIFHKPNPNNTNTNNLINKNRKRSFEMMNNGFDKENINIKKKRNRLTNIINKSEMTDIINKKSINNNILNEINKDNFYNELNDLENEEKLANELEVVTSVQINVFICKFRKCALKDKIMETQNSFCKMHSGNVVKTVGRKYFWRCKNCKFKTFSINMKRNVPKCKHCGGRDFKPASAYNLSKPKMIGKEKLILVNNRK